VGPKPEVVVLGAVEGPPAEEGPQDPTPRHHARVHEGRLDEKIGDDRVVVEEGVRPIHVRAHARVGGPVHGHPTAEHVDRRVFVQAKGLPLQPIRPRDVVRVHAGHERSADRLEAGVQGGNEAASRAHHHSDPGVLPRVGLQEGQAPVRRSVVDGHDLVLAEGLGAQGEQALPEGQSRVANGQENRDGRGQRCRATNSRAAFIAPSSEAPSTTK
jgi:hypothetical protein